MKQISLVLASASLVLMLALVLFLTPNVASPVFANGIADQTLVQEDATPISTDTDLGIITAEGESYEITMGGNCNKPPRRPPPCNGPPGRHPGNS